MTEENNIPSSVGEETSPAPRREHQRPKRNVVFFIRQVLNILFMLLAIVGVAMYMGCFGDGKQETMGLLVIIMAVFVKMAECVIRVFSPKK